MVDINKMVKTQKIYEKGVKALKKVGGAPNARKLLASKLKKKKTTAQ